MRARVTSLLVVLCGCGVPALSRSESSFSVSPSSLELPDTWVGATSSGVLRVTNHGTPSLPVAASLDAPFTITPREGSLGGGDEVELTVSVSSAVAGAFEGRARLTIGGVAMEVPVSGRVLQAPQCAAANPCQPATFDPVRGACVSTALPDGAQCSPSDECLERAVCVSGECVGALRSCDDHDVCTTDACSASCGCVHAPVSCGPPIDAPCKVPSCDPVRGCVSLDAPDGTSCGAADCVEAHVCMTGECRAVAVPEGARCGATSPCAGPGVCHSLSCVQTDAGVLTPEWTYTSPSARPTYVLFNGLTDEQGNLAFAECRPNDDCELVSLTPQGLERFRVPLLGTTRVTWGPPRAAMVLSGVNVITAVTQHLQAHRMSDGALVWVSPLCSEPDGGRSAGCTFDQLVDDGLGALHLRVVTGTGNQALARVDLATGAQTSIEWGSQVSDQAADEAGRLYVLHTNLSPMTSTLAARETDGGVRWQAPVEGGASLAVANGRVLVTGSSSAALFDTATGARLTTPLAGSQTDNATGVLSSSGAAIIERPGCCPTCHCPALPAPLRLAHLTHDGLLEWTSGLPATSAAAKTTDPLLTSSGDVLVASTTVDFARVPAPGAPQLTAFDAAGAVRFSCALPGAPSLPTLYGPTSALRSGRWTVAVGEQCPYCGLAGDDLPSRIESYALPGYDAAAGWSTSRGSLARTGRPR